MLKKTIIGHLNARKTPTLAIYMTAWRSLSTPISKLRSLPMREKKIWNMRKMKTGEPFKALREKLGELSELLYLLMTSSLTL